MFIEKCVKLQWNLFSSFIPTYDIHLTCFLSKKFSLKDSYLQWTLRFKFNRVLPVKHHSYWTVLNIDANYFNLLVILVIGFFSFWLVIFSESSGEIRSKNSATKMGFEPTRAKHTGFLQYIYVVSSPAP